MVKQGVRESACMDGARYRPSTVVLVSVVGDSYYMCLLLTITKNFSNTFNQASPS